MYVNFLRIVRDRVQLNPQLAVWSSRFRNVQRCEGMSMMSFYNSKSSLRLIAKRGTIPLRSFVFLSHRNMPYAARKHNSEKQQQIRPQVYIVGQINQDFGQIVHFEVQA